MRTSKLLYILGFILIATGCVGPETYYYERGIHLHDVNVEIETQDPIETQLKIKPPFIASGTIGLAYKNRNPHSYIELSNAEIGRQFQRALNKNFKRSNIYRSATDFDIESRGHSLKTTLSIYNVIMGVASKQAFGKVRRTSEVEIEYAVISKKGKIIANGSIKEEGRFDDPLLVVSREKNIEFTVRAVQNALSKAAARIPEELAKNQQFIHLARTDAISNQSIVFNTYNESSLSPKPTNTAYNSNATVEGPVSSGAYYGIVIGNNNYANFQNLKTAENDANSVAKLLRSKYNYSVKVVRNGTRSNILKELDKLRSKLTKNDNLLIYYAGHGLFDKEANRGYWLPIDAQPDTTANWVSNTDITDKVKAIAARHVMIVSDSCFSGTLTRGVNISIRSPDYFQQISALRSRTVLTSGGVEPVADSGGGGHSVFANAFLKALEQNAKKMDGTELFTKIRRPVMLNANQTPQYSDIRMAGHEGGDFLFIRNNK